jgi:hypothetical protein
MKRLLMAVLVMGWASPVWGEINFVSGNALHEECQIAETDNVYYQADAYCIGYILGVFDAANGPDNGVAGFTFCTPDEINLNQVRDIVVKWLSDHPQHRHHDANSLVATALREVWPCP